jgi:hypothetical protein
VSTDTVSVRFPKLAKTWIACHWILEGLIKRLKVATAYLSLASAAAVRIVLEFNFHTIR